MYVTYVLRNFEQCNKGRCFLRIEKYHSRIFDILKLSICKTGIIMIEWCHCCCRFPDAKDHPLPNVISVPLIKTESGGYAALRSGQRSAILPTTAGCYRLKGCGHYLDDDDKLRLPYPSFSVSKIEVSESFLNV